MDTTTLTARIARCWKSTTEPSAARIANLTIAHEMGADDAAFSALCEATRISRTDTIVLPAHRYEGMARGRGWCRKGRQASAVWGDRTSDGYRVGSGRWTVGGNDGFSRKGETSWDVRHVTVAGQTWTVAG